MTAVNIAAGIGALALFGLVVYGLSMGLLLLIRRQLRLVHERQLREEAHALRRD